MHTRRPIILVAIVGLLGAVLFTGTAAADDTPDTQPTPTEVPDTTSTPSTVLVCNLWDGTPHDYWKVQEMSSADADWWVANATNASIVASTADCPGNAPVSICHVYDDGHKLVSVDPWTANWYLANSPGDYVPANGSCSGAEPSPEPTPEPAAEPTTEPTPEAITEPAAEPTPEPTPEPTTEPAAEPTTSGGVDSSGGGNGGTDTPTTAVQGVVQERQELAVTGVESWHLTLAGLTMLVLGIVVNSLRRRLQPATIATHARR